MKIGSVRPNGVVNRLDQTMVFRCCGKAEKTASHGTRKALDQTSQTYCSAIISRYLRSASPMNCGLHSV
jgi:hypothetical protein